MIQRVIAVLVAAISVFIHFVIPLFLDCGRNFVRRTKLDRAFAKPQPGVASMTVIARAVSRITLAFAIAMVGVAFSIRRKASVYSAPAIQSPKTGGTLLHLHKCVINSMAIANRCYNFRTFVAIREYVEIEHNLPE